MKDSTFVAGGLLVAVAIGYGALHQPARVVADAPEVSATPTGPRSSTASAAPTARSTPPASRLPSTPADASYVAKLGALSLAPRLHRSDYDRDAFGTSWRDTDHNGCNQRDDVLVRDAIPGTVRTAEQGSCDHDVRAGSWLDPYTGRRIDLTDAKEPAQAQAVQIDHVVPLSEAWSSGAWAWTAERRVDFANELGELLAVDGPTNASKGDDDPAAWRPRKGYQCAYARRWITVKVTWKLEVDASERNALEEMLGYC
jgi:hypothetical protein